MSMPRKQRSGLRRIWEPRSRIMLPTAASARFLLPAEEAVRPSFRGWIANGSAWAADARIFSLLRMMKWLIVSRLPRGSCALSSREISVPETIVS